MSKGNNNSWTWPAELRARVERLWERGDLLRSVVADAQLQQATATDADVLQTPEADHELQQSAESVDGPSQAAANSRALQWPLRLSLKTPTSAELGDRFPAVRDWVREIGNMPHIRIEWRVWSHRIQGKQRLPAAVWLDSLQDALSMTGRTKDARQFKALWQETSVTQPALLAWLHRHPLQALALSAQWDRLFAVLAWVQARPRPGIYLRQVDAPGVDSKFIESNRGILTQWLDLVLPAEAINQEARGVAQFARRFGFLDKPLRIRLRLLDKTLPSLPGCLGLTDITLDADSFATLALPVQRVFITENEINFLAFPQVPGSIAVFGAGYGWEALADATWLQACTIHYWGDIDTHGFAILDSLRAHFPHVKSLLMDRDTLFAHRLQWGEEPADKRHLHPLLRLTQDETHLYDELRHDQIMPCLRLEQERTGYRWLCDALDRLA